MSDRNNREQSKQQLVHRLIHFVNTIVIKATEFSF